MPKKKSVKKKSAKKDSKNVCEPNSMYHYNIGFIKLSSMAFILFLVLVWTKLGTALLSLHWGWYLGIFVLLGAAGASNYKHHKCC